LKSMKDDAGIRTKKNIYIQMHVILGEIFPFAQLLTHRIDSNTSKAAFTSVHLGKKHCDDELGEKCVSKWQIS